MLLMVKLAIHSSPNSTIQGFLKLSGCQLRSSCWMMNRKNSPGAQRSGSENQKATKSGYAFSTNMCTQYLISNSSVSMFHTLQLCSENHTSYLQDFNSWQSNYLIRISVEFHTHFSLPASAYYKYLPTWLIIWPVDHCLIICGRVYNATATWRWDSAHRPYLDTVTQG